jgi:hypothetical protein
MKIRSSPQMDVGSKNLSREESDNAEVTTPIYLDQTPAPLLRCVSVGNGNELGALFVHCKEGAAVWENAMHDLRGIDTPVDAGRSAKIVGAIVVALVIVGGAVATYDAGLWAPPPKQIVPDKDLPSPSPPPGAQPMH